MPVPKQITCKQCTGRGFHAVQDLDHPDGTVEERKDPLLRAAMTAVRHWQRFGAFGFEAAITYLRRAAETRKEEIQ